RRRLPRPVRPQKAEHLPPRHLQVQAVHGDERAPRPASVDLTQPHRLDGELTEALLHQRPAPLPHSQAMSRSRAVTRLQDNPYPLQYLAYPTRRKRADLLIEPALVERED